MTLMGRDRGVVIFEVERVFEPVGPLRSKFTRENGLEIVVVGDIERVVSVERNVCDASRESYF
jgi:hypothetical protein